MKILYRKTFSICIFLAVMFMIVGTAAATETNPADFHLGFNDSTSSFTHQFIPFSTDVQHFWSWDFGDGSQKVSGQNSRISAVTHTYRSAGFYTVTLEVITREEDTTVDKRIPVGLSEA